MSTVRELLATDDTFREVADLLFGGGGDELIAKMNPDQADLATRKRQRKQAQIGLASNVVGLGAGIGGTAAALRDPRLGDPKAPGVLRALHRAGSRIPAPISSKTGKAGALLAGGALGLQGANIAGDAVANRVLARSAKKEKVKKDIAEVLETASERSSHLTRAPMPSKAKAAGAGAEYLRKKGAFRRLPDKVKTVQKSAGPGEQVEVVWDGEIAKADSEKQQIFGWASVVEVNGEPVLDLQGDVITPEEMEKAAYTYVQKSRKGGDMHLRNGWEPIKKSEMIESFIVTDEKRQAMGLPSTVPTGWWVGFAVQDPQVWADIKDGKRTGFSIHGHGRRTPA